jgi:NAD-dependent SIR2 family protein deacetylase
MQTKCKKCHKTLNAHSLHDAIASSPIDKDPKCSYCGEELEKAAIKIILGSKI